MMLPSSDFLYGAATVVGALGVYRAVKLFSVPSIEKMERDARKPLNIKPAKDDEIVVWGFTEATKCPGWEDGVSDLSHYVVKVEAYLRLLGQPYTKKQSLDLSENPRGKVPFASVFGVVLDDSSRIIKQIRGALPKETSALDSHVTEEQHRQGYLMQEMLSGTLYWVMVAQRMTQPLGRQLMLENLGRNGLPPVIRYMVGAMIWRTSYSALYGQGTIRFPRSEIVAKGREAVACLSSMLGENEFLFGNKPSSYDADLYAWLVILFFDPAHKSYEWVLDCKRDFPNLVSYVESMRGILFPEI